MRLLLSALVAFCMLLLSPAGGQDDRARWISVFEQSYGTEGLYPVELYPEGEAGKSRLNLQDLSTAAARMEAARPGVRPTIAGLRLGGLLPELRPIDPPETYEWDDEFGFFVSSAGKDHSLLHGAMLLLRGNEIVRARLLQPDVYTRNRWKRIYEDGSAPEFIKREIILREFLLEHQNTPQARVGMRLQETLSLLEEATKLYALAEGLELGAEVTMEELQESRLVGFIERPPDEVELILGRVGEPHRARFRGIEITSDASSVRELQLAEAAAVLEKYPGFPPAIVLRARFEEPAQAIALADEAVKLWPDVPGLRIERLAQYARARDASRWTADMDFILKEFPAAPHLLELQVTAELAGVTDSPEARARFATMLADVRPDLLGHQIHALTTLRAVGDSTEANRILARLVETNPAWASVLPDPMEK